MLTTDDITIPGLYTDNPRVQIHPTTDTRYMPTGSRIILFEANLAGQIVNNVGADTSTSLILVVSINTAKTRIRYSPVAELRGDISASKCGDWLSRHRMHCYKSTESRARLATVHRLDMSYSSYLTHVRRSPDSVRKLLLTIVEHLRLYLSCQVMNLILPEIKMPNYDIDLTKDLTKYLDLLDQEIYPMYMAVRKYFDYSDLMQVD